MSNAKRSQLVKRIVTPYFLLLTFALAVAVTFIYLTFIARLQRDADISHTALAERSAEQVADFITDLSSIADQINHRSDITGIFYEHMEESHDGNVFDTDILSAIDVSSALLNIVIDRSADLNIAVYNGAGDYISSHSYMIDKAKLAGNMPRLRQRAQTVFGNGNTQMTVYPPRPDPNSYSDMQYITVTKPLKNDDSDIIAGVIEVRGNAALLDAVLYSEDSALYLRDRITHTPFYPVPEEEALQNIAVASVAGTDLEIVIHYADPVNPQFIRQSVFLFAVIFLFLAGLFFMVTLRIGRSVTQPIKQMVERLGQINFPSEQMHSVDEGAIDEIKELEKSFDRMLARVGESTMQERKAYMLALQAQMNPHFLYNTLAVIGACGTEAGCEKVSDMCVRLSDILRYVASYGNMIVPLREELLQTENYLSLMKDRYEDGFSYSIDADEALLDMKVFKLLIQPLAENCFKHAFKAGGDAWRIEISLHGTPESFTLIIRDNGVGMNDAKIAELSQNIDKACETMSLSNVGGVGLVNTIVRLKLMQGKRIRYRILCRNGTEITIQSETETS